MPAALLRRLGFAVLVTQAQRHSSSRWRGAPSTRRAAAVQRDGISLDEAVRACRSASTSARVVRTDVQDEDGRKVYVLKLLSEDGACITVRIDAATGRMR